MSLDVYLVDENDCEVYWANITHNLGKMAKEAGIYQALWRPREIPVYRAKDLIPFLENGIQKLVDAPSKYMEFNASNGWGLYENFLPWCCRYLEACRKYPEARIQVSV